MLRAESKIKRYSKLERLIRTNMVILRVMCYTNNKRTTNNLKNSYITLLHPHARFSPNKSWVIFQTNCINRFDNKTIEFGMNKTEENP